MEAPAVIRRRFFVITLAATENCPNVIHARGEARVKEARQNASFCLRGYQ